MRRVSHRPSKTTAKDLAYEYVKGLIVTDQIPEGEFLTEGEIATELGISRTPVREAFLRLEVESLLRLLPQKGAFLPPISNREINDAFEARSLIETFAVKRVVSDQSSIAPALEDLLDQQVALAKQRDVEEFIACDRLFHQRIVKATGNAILFRMYESLRDRQLRMGIRAVLSTAERFDQVLREHGEIVRGIKSGNEANAILAIKKHLETTMSVLLASKHA
jgi:DNA-binding GntR family transcriptional regulator